MSLGLRRSNRFLCVEQNDPTGTVFSDHMNLDRCSEVTITDQGAGLVSVLFTDAQRQFTITPDGRLETRARGAIGGWELFAIAMAADLTTIARAGVTLNVVGDLHPPAPPPGTLSRLHTDNWNFVNETGQVVTWAHTSGFRDLDRLLRGQDLRPVLAQSQDEGGTGRRCFAMKQNWAIKVNGVWQDGPDHTWPREHATYYEQIERLADLYREFGHYLNLVVFVNARSVMPDINEQLRFWDRMIAIARQHPNLILSLMNEGNAHDNAVDVGRFPQPDGVLASSGSNGAGANPPQPFWRGPWGYCELHPERRADRPSLGTSTLHFAIHGYAEGSDSWPGTQMVTVASEPYGFDEENEPGRRTNEPQVAWLLGLGCTWGSGGTGLSTDGIESVVLRPKQDACMRLFLAGVKAGRR